MRYTIALLMKLVMIYAVLWIVLGLFFGVNFGDIILTSIILTTMAFVVDVFILPRIGNILAVIGDFAFSFISIWVIGAYFFEGVFPLITASFISALIISGGELIYYRYLRNNVFTNVDNRREINQTTNLQTEASEELNPNIKKNKQR